MGEREKRDPCGGPVCPELPDPHARGGPRPQAPKPQGITYKTIHIRIFLLLSSPLPRRQGDSLPARLHLSSNCLESQWEWVRDLVAGWFQDEPYLSIELGIISSLRIQAVRASFFGLPADNRRW